MFTIIAAFYLQVEVNDELFYRLIPGVAAGWFFLGANTVVKLKPILPKTF